MSKKYIPVLLAFGCLLQGGLAHAQTQDATSLQSLQLSSESDDAWKKQPPPDSPKAAIATLDNLSTSSDHTKILDSLKFCASTLDKDTRLSCYNDIATQNGIQVKPLRGAADIAEANSHWIIRSNDSDRDYLGAISSDTPIDDRGVKLSNPVTLYFRCHQGNPLLYLKGGENVGKESVAVTIMSSGLDSNAVDKAGHYSFMPSKSGDAFGIWSRDAVAVLSSYLKDAGAVIIHYKVGDRPEISAHFDLSNMREETGNISKACRI